MTGPEWSLLTSHGRAPVCSGERQRPGGLPLQDYQSVRIYVSDQFSWQDSNLRSRLRRALLCMPLTCEKVLQHRRSGHASDTPRQAETTRARTGEVPVSSRRVLSRVCAAATPDLPADAHEGGTAAITDSGTDCQVAALLIPRRTPDRRRSSLLLRKGSPNTYMPDLRSTRLAP